MKPAKLRRNREELQREAEENFIPEDAENPFLPKYTPPVVCETCRKPKLPCHVPNCNDPHCDRWHEGEEA